MSDDAPLPKAYEPAEVEPRLYDWWESGGLFHAEPDDPGEPFCICIPLPNITGSIAGTSGNPGVTATTLPSVVGTLAGAMTNSGSLAATLPRVAGSVLDFIIPPLPIDGVSLTVSVDTRGLSVTTETRSLEVET
jgi:hypothetical protein